MGGGSDVCVSGSGSESTEASVCLLHLSLLILSFADTFLKGINKALFAIMLIYGLNTS